MKNREKVHVSNVQGCHIEGRKWSGKKEILQAQGEVKKFYFESGKIGILKKAPEGKIEII